MDLLTEERQSIIVNMLSEKSILKLKDLVKLLDASESTIRRDLDELEAKGLLKRVHGGAVAVNGSFTLDYSIDERTGKFLTEKIAIAKYCASLIEDGDYVYLDSGTTTLEMIPYLSEKNITVVTNGVHNAQKLVENRVKTYLLGGEVKPKTQTVIGEQAVLNLLKFRFTKAFIGANGITFKSAITTPDDSEAVIKKLAIDLSKDSYVVVDSSKFGSVSFAKICDLDDVTIVTNKSDNKIDKRIINVATIIEL
ncbi:DeoR/GlpR family DNA-binding transcription regulator [Peptostreptococcus porci]|uniref:DeoR/GlpR family DNA-binding transcription regulator n=1 Tax=Peptostreptococcus porci TaxID=2652282 RepID=UPI001F41111D|nr:DeoR/GlpR family DNA-binding transcription regulator [Peptostreptococcus porci]MDD7183783.1 DeoR/GlpR family DNA-binding transcription regulator [Peptostreptococcus porci]MDY5964653.1 DeoR/GlpR family DNA-binding transcription regulator [Peptostreptococcus porci]MDY6231783.1 DeoR/GlpR family DNA-binding transcription regulator [Peptostreptococcus porci]